MKGLVRMVLIMALAPGLMLGAKDKADEYQIGAFVASTSVDDGTLTSTIRGDGTTVAGGVYANHVGVYTIKVADGTWYVETRRQAIDHSMRNLGWTPSHFKSEKPNPLDALKGGDRVLFRVETHKKIGGTEIDMFVPFADKPDKEETFIAVFKPDYQPTEQPKKPTDNVKALCDSGRLSAERKSQLCAQ